MLEVKQYRIEAVREILRQSSLTRSIVSMRTLAACAR